MIDFEKEAAQIIVASTPAEVRDRLLHIAALVAEECAEAEEYNVYRKGNASRLLAAEFRGETAPTKGEQAT